MLFPGGLHAQTTLFSESFDDANLSGRGWYDTSGVPLSTVEHIPGSVASYACRFSPGATGCSGGVPGRHALTATDSVFISFHIKHSENWVGSGLSYHPHMFYFLTNENDAYVGPAYTHLTAYIEENEGYPQLAIQDGQNIDESKIGQDLIGITESRSVAGCNGVATNIGYSHVDCYSVSANTHWNGIAWKGPNPWFFDQTPGPTFKSDWHLVEAYFKLNSISGGVGVSDGIVQYWYDGQLVIDHHNVILRTGQHPNMKFNQLLMAFYIGDGSPVDQTIWIDDLTIATARPNPLPIPDAGPQPQDASPLPRDANPLPQESGSPQDGSPPTTDTPASPRREGSVADLSTAGGSDRSSQPRANILSSGCGCRAVPGDDMAGFGWLLLTAGLLLARRR